MAAELGTKASSPKYEAFIDAQLGRVRTRICALDAGRSLLMLGIVTAAYFLAMAAFDLAVGEAETLLVLATRFLAFGTYLVLTAILLFQLGAHCYRRINPYYAARQLEEHLADPKNSVINWLDLKGAELPGAIRSAVGQRAALALKHADPELAVSPKSNWLLGGILTGLALGIVILFGLGPRQFNSLLQRAFAPFLKIGIDTRTEISLLKPAGGDVTVPLNHHVDFQASIGGRFPKLGQPGAPRLLYRYQTGDLYVPLALDEAHDGTWTATLLGDQVQNGFWYKIAAGDTETPEYQVKVQSWPQVARFDVTYHYRPYRKMADETVVFPNEQAVLPRLRDYRGTEVEMLIHTNRALRAGGLQLDINGVRTEVPGEVLASDSRTMRTRLTLEQRGTFRVVFTSKDGEENSDRTPYQIEVLDDLAPHVVFTKPAQDVVLPPNGTLALAGKARDDIGIKSLALRLKVINSPGYLLAPKAYRAEKSFQFADGTYPDALDYQDILYLDKLKTAQGEAVLLKAGMVIEYALEARDNADYPRPDGNVGVSQAYKITISDAKKEDKQQKEEREQAEQQQKKHEEQQDKQQAQDNKKRQDEQAKNDAPPDEKKKKDIEDKMNQVRQELDKEKQSKKDKPNQKPEETAGNEQKQGENKPGSDAGNSKPDNKGAQNQEQTGAKKDAGKPGQGEQPGTAKDAPEDARADKQRGETKGPGTARKKTVRRKPTTPKPGKRNQAQPRSNPRNQRQAKRPRIKIKRQPKRREVTRAGQPPRANPRARPRGMKLARATRKTRQTPRAKLSPICKKK